MPSVRLSSSWKAGARISAWGATEADTKSTFLIPSATPAAAISFFASAMSAALSARYPGRPSSSFMGVANSLAWVIQRVSMIGSWVPNALMRFCRLTARLIARRTRGSLKGLRSLLTCTW